MIGYKLFRVRKDGSIGPLFINRKQRLEIGPTYLMEEHRTKGFAFRPGWHICTEPNAPHLSMKGRAWFKVEIEISGIIPRPKSQGGVWYLGRTLTILEKL